MSLSLGNDGPVPLDDRAVIVRSPRVRLLDPYTLVANVVMQTKSATHLPALTHVDDVPRAGIFVCGLNSASKPLTPTPVRINGATLVTCRRCTMTALLMLARRKRLRWSKCGRSRR